MTSRDTEEKIRKLRSVDPKKANAAWLLYLSGERGERESADNLVDVALFQRVQKDYEKKIFLEPPSKESCLGEYPLGTILYPPNKSYCSFGLREEEWIRHILITGMAGAGKTNLAFQILRRLKEHQKPFLVFDWKRNYRDLIQLPEFRKACVFTVGRDVAPFHFNPLIPPPGAQPGQWMMKLVDVLKHAYFVGEGVEYLLREAIDQTYEQCGFIDGSRVETPTFFQIRDYVARKSLQGRMSLWKASATRVLESLCFRHGLGPVLNTSKELDHEWFLANDIILELDPLSDADKIFFAEALILWLYEFRQNEGKREHFKHALIIEEGHHILSHKKEAMEGVETIMETSLRQIREFGESVIVIDQEPHKISNSLKANTYAKICFNLGNGKDVFDMSNCMRLNKEETVYMDWLETGQAIVSLKGRVHTPLHVQFPKVAVKKGFVEDKELTRRFRSKAYQDA